MFVNSQLVCLLPVGVFNLVVFNLNYLFLKFNCLAHQPLAINIDPGYLFYFYFMTRFYVRLTIIRW